MRMISVMKVVFRVDASIDLGTGHVMRCLTLAQQICEMGGEVFFICKELNGDLCEYIKNKGYQVFSLQNKKNTTNFLHSSSNSWQTDVQETILILKQIKNIDWLVVDHYSLDKKWELLIRSYVKHVMVIDDLANREHNCDLLLDQNYYKNQEKRYQHLVPTCSKLLLGPKFALLRKEFSDIRQKGINMQKELIKKIFIFLGGSDPGNITTNALEAIEKLKYDYLIFDVVVGVSNKHKEEIRLLCDRNHHFNFLFNVENIAQVMKRADLCIVSGGTITWERYSLGLIGGIITTAKNQEELAETVHELQIDHYFGKAEELSQNKIMTKIESLIKTPFNHLKQRRESAVNLVDGKGAQRVIKEMNDFSKIIAGE